MQVAIVQSVSGVVSIVTNGESRGAQVGDQVAINSMVVTAANSECILSHGHGDVLIGAQQKLFVDQDVLGLFLDSGTEALTNAASFQHAIVQIALADPDHVLTKLLSNLNNLLGQSLDKNVFVDSPLSEDHSLYLDLASDEMQTQDLLAVNLVESASSATELSLEEAIHGEVYASVSDEQSISVPSILGGEGARSLINLLELSRDSFEFDGLIAQLVQGMDLSHHFSDGGALLANINPLTELGLQFDDERYLREIQYDQI
ncbi:hypothetical protein THMIRHAS_20730 [Thiosulfatimonas sediminis]|uniref:Retention module-containing protein n=1 Tax=Thiosulfatimonas sediminis TaxID=2675054 RepID=A0A6F8PXK5_9GAMM|nr:hypothetical protein [Thiosulfatimonas sediminis]BBP46700.1 hypothetical protein THMIRHAS_20730 [Thiosulfatimonas sediminis]